MITINWQLCVKLSNSISEDISTTQFIGKILPLLDQEEVNTLRKAQPSVSKLLNNSGHTNNSSTNSQRKLFLFKDLDGVGLPTITPQRV